MAIGTCQGCGETDIEVHGTPPLCELCSFNRTGPIAKPAPKEKLTDLARREPDPIALGRAGVELRSLEELYRFATAIEKSGLGPKGDSAQAIMVKVQAGAELGLSPIRSLTYLTAINGRVGIMGDAAKALVRASGVLDGDIVVTLTGEGDGRAATVTAARRGHAPVSRTFAVADAKRAGLWGKDGPWKQYPDRMLAYRAWGFLARDEFSDVLLGLHTAEELHDYPAAPAVRQAPAEPDPVFES